MHGDISMFLEWRQGDMSGEQMKSVSNIFEQLLAKILSSENTAISQLNLFSENDWQRIRQWNSTIPQLYDRCIHDAIHDQMLSGPEREAVCAWDGNLTFAELDQQASKLAYHLRMQGVGPEIRVALCFDKSVGSQKNRGCWDQWLTFSIEMEYSRNAWRYESRRCFLPIGSYSSDITAAGSH
jgi:hypothetical protein